MWRVERGGMGEDERPKESSSSLCASPFCLLDHALALHVRASHTGAQQGGRAARAAGEAPVPPDAAMRVPASFSPPRCRARAPSRLPLPQPVCRSAPFLVVVKYLPSAMAEGERGAVFFAAPRPEKRRSESAAAVTLSHLFLLLLSLSGPTRRARVGTCTTCLGADTLHTPAQLCASPRAAWPPRPPRRVPCLRPAPLPPPPPHQGAVSAWARVGATQCRRQQRVGAQATGPSTHSRSCTTRCSTWGATMGQRFVCVCVVCVKLCETREKNKRCFLNLFSFHPPPTDRLHHRRPRHPRRPPLPRHLPGCRLWPRPPRPRGGGGGRVGVDRSRLFV